MSETTAPKREKVAIVGFASSWDQAPFEDQSFEIWGLNELYLYFQKHPHGRADRWFELHDIYSPSKNTKEHLPVLQEMTIPIYTREHYDFIPSSVPFPKDEIIEWLQSSGKTGYRYFTNSISWMIALAIYEGFKEIHIYGVDMATDSEYGHQRPSCEYFIGLAEGLGAKLYIPADSELLKAPLLYAFDTDNAMRLKIKSRIKDITERENVFRRQKAKAEQERDQAVAAINQALGGKQALSHLLHNWTQ